MRRPFAAAVVAAALGAIVATGCGDQGETPLSKAEFLEQADEICAKSNDEIDAIRDRLIARGGGPSDANLRAFAGEVLPKLDKLVSDLRALPAPAGDEDRLDAAFDATEAALDRSGDDPLTSGTGRFDESNRLVADYGFTGECAGSPPR